MKSCLITGGTGYIGSALRLTDRFREAEWLDIAAERVDDYRLVDFLSPFDVAIHLAGHSSVVQCEASPYDAVSNNIHGFVELLRRTSVRANRPLVLWASSGSVLSGVTSIYDSTKRALEALVPRLYPNSIGLRFASVCGPSPNMRHDLILNAMVKSALETGVINVSNPNISKPILAMADLCESVRNLIEDRRMLPKIVNLSSFTTTPMRAAQCVADQTGAKIAVNPPSRCYEFDMVPWNSPRETLESTVAALVRVYGRVAA